MSEKKQDEKAAEAKAPQRKRVFGRDERSERETQRRATAYGRARGLS